MRSLNLVDDPLSKKKVIRMKDVKFDSGSERDSHEDDEEEYFM